MSDHLITTRHLNQIWQAVLQEVEDLSVIQIIDKNGNEITKQPALQLKFNSITLDADNHKIIIEPSDGDYDAQKISYGDGNVKNVLDKSAHLTGLRYKKLGSQPTAAQLEKIATGDFTEFWNGDYWEYGGKIYRIVDNTDYYYGKGDTAFSKHGLIIMPDDNMLNADGSTTKYMYDSNDNSKGYLNTKYRQSYRAGVKSTVASWCGSDHIGTFRDLQTNSVTNGHAQGWAWESADVELPSEIQIYGSNIWHFNKGSADAWHGYDTGISFPQFALFRLAPKHIRVPGKHYWLRNTVGASRFASVYSTGNATYNYAAYTNIGVRPLFILV